MISYNLFVSFSHSLFWYCMYDVFFLIATGSFSNLTFFSKLLVSKNFSDKNGKSLIDVFYSFIHYSYYTCCMNIINILSSTSVISTLLLFVIKITSIIIISKNEDMHVFPSLRVVALCHS